MDKFNNKRIIIANKYLKKINSKKLILPKMNSLKKHVFHLFVVRVKNNQRSKVLNYLNKYNIYIKKLYILISFIYEPLCHGWHLEILTAAR